MYGLQAASNHLTSQKGSETLWGNEENENVLYMFEDCFNFFTCTVYVFFLQRMWECKPRHQESCPCLTLLNMSQETYTQPVSGKNFATFSNVLDQEAAFAATANIVFTNLAYETKLNHFFEVTTVVCRSARSPQHQSPIAQPPAGNAGVT